jgi:hypothetical protein
LNHVDIKLGIDQMRHAKIFCVLSLLTITACQDKAPPQQKTEVVAPSDESKDASAVKPDLPLKDIINSVMTEQYGADYNDKYQCWDYTLESSESSSSYCMKPSEATVIDTAEGKAIYFFASNRIDMNDDINYAYSSVDSGLMGAFKLAVDIAGKWTYSASNKAMNFGSVGYCGCDKAQLMKLGSDAYYGWIFTSGGVWQGIVATNHEIVAPNGNTFENISRIPEIREGAQDVKYTISVVDTAKDKKIFPLLVAKLKSDVKEKEMTVSFDDKKRVYALPENF